MAAIFGEGKIFGKLQRLHSLDTLWVENFDEIALSRTVKEIDPCHFWQKFENSKWPPFLGKNFLKIANITFLRYPDENRSISHG